MKKLILIVLLSCVSAHAMENEIKRAVLAGNVPRARELLEQGADVHRRYEHEYWENCWDNRWTLLHYAVWSESPDMVELLLNHGADINAQKNNYSTPLHLAACNDFSDIVALLLNRGADVNMRNEINETPYDAAHGGARTIMEDFRAQCSRIKGIPMSEGSQ